MQSSHVIIDRKLKHLQRERAAGNFSSFGFLKAECCERLADRLTDIRRIFPRVLELGSHDGTLSRLLGERGGIAELVQTDFSLSMLVQATGLLRVTADEEFLPFAAESFDAVLSAMSLHWANDLPGALIQLRHALKEDGLLLACMPGGNTLIELRESFMRASIETEGGASPHVIPFIDVRDAGALLQRAGFALPVVDSDTITITYENVFSLLADLRGMGETNALIASKNTPLKRATLARMVEIYTETFPAEGGGIRASIEIVTLTGWKPHASQQKPLARGSGKIPFAAALMDAPEKKQ